MMKKFMVLIISLLIYSFSYASINLQSITTDGRIQLVPYQANNVVSVSGSTFVSTQIVFSTHDHIVDIQGGDAWTINVDKYLPNILNLMPTLIGSNSNI